MISKTCLLVLVCLIGGCGTGVDNEMASRVAFARGFTQTSAQEGTSCKLTAEGPRGQRARLDCPEVEPETVDKMVKAVCASMKRVGFRHVLLTSEAEGGRCDVATCTCQMESAAPGVGPTAPILGVDSGTKSASDAGPSG